MRNNKARVLLVVTAFMLVLELGGCQFIKASPETQQVSIENIEETTSNNLQNKENQSIEMTPGRENYPATPEQVVHEFLLSYQDQPSQIIIYMSHEMVEKMSSGEIQSLLPIDGILEGYSFQAAAVSPEPPNAMVIVGLQINGEEISYTFTLLKEDGFWVINSIQ